MGRSKVFPAFYILILLLGLMFAFNGTSGDLNLGSRGLNITPVLDSPPLNITFPPNDSFVNSSNITVRWEIINNGIDVNRTETKIDDGPWTDVGTNTSQKFSNLTEGLHEVQIAVIFNSSFGDQENVSFFVDLTPPHLHFISPVEGLVTNREVTISWNGTDSGSGIGGYEVRADCRNWTVSDGPSSHTFHFGKDGFHAVEVAALDRAGNRLEKAFSFVIDTYPPELSILTPEDGMMSQDGNIRITWEGGDNGTGLQGYWFRINDRNWTFLGGREDRTIWSLHDGRYIIQVMAVDLAGNTMNKEVNITVDGTPPELRVIAPADGSFTDSSPVTVMWNGTDAVSGPILYEVRLGDDIWRDVGEDTTFTMVNLKEGTYTFGIRARDQADNLAVIYTTFTLDRTRPEVITRFPTGEDVDPDSVISVTFSEKMSKSTLQFRVDGLEGSLEWRGGRVIFVPETELSYGRTYNVTIVGWDIAGNMMPTSTWTFRTTNKGILQGYVVDRNGEPVGSAEIFIDGGNRTRTREDGYFTINVEAGDRILMVKADGYRTVRTQIHLDPGETNTIDRLVMSMGGSGENSSWTWLLWVATVIISLAVVTALALYLGSGRSPTGTLEE